MLRSQACADDCLWHVPHSSPWKTERGSPSDLEGARNRNLAREFFLDRMNDDGVRLVAEPGEASP